LILQKLWWRAADGLPKASSAIGGLLFLTLFGCLLIQIFGRFVLDRPAAWTEEVAATAFLWVIFWGGAFVTPLSEHVAIDLLEARFGRRTRRISEALGLLVVGACFAWSLPGVIDYVMFMGREHTPVADLPLSWVYAVFVAFVAMIVARCLLGVVKPPAHHVPPPELDQP
jgi:TRAP-type C4-dicarboxylate transport system permease small subunit